MNKSPINAAQAAKGWAGSKEQEVWYKAEIADAIQGLADAVPFAARSFSSVDSYDEGMGFLRFEKVFDFFQFVLLSGWFLTAGLPPRLYFL